MTETCCDEEEKEIFRPECNANFESVHCRAYLNVDIGETLPYLTEPVFVRV